MAKEIVDTHQTNESPGITAEIVENPVISELRQKLTALITKVNEAPNKPIGCSMSYALPTKANPSESRIYLANEDGSERWSVQIVRVLNTIPDPPVQTESLHIFRRRKAMVDANRFDTLHTTIFPFLVFGNKRGLMGSVQSVEQVNPDGSKSLVKQKEITLGRMNFRRAGKKYKDVGAKRAAAVTEIMSDYSRQDEQYVQQNFKSRIAKAVSNLVANGFRIDFSTVSVKHARRVGLEEKIISLRPRAEQYIMQGIIEVLRDELALEEGEKFAGYKEVIKGIAKKLFTYLIGTWNEALEEKHGELIVDGTGILLIPSIELDTNDQISSAMTSKWEELASSQKDIKLSDEEMLQMVRTLQSLSPCTPRIEDLNISESDEMFRLHQELLGFSRRKTPLSVID